MDCWKYCKGYRFVLSVACLRAKKPSASGGGGKAPDQALPLDPTGGLTQAPRYRLALHALTMFPQKTAHGPPCSSTLALALGTQIWVLPYSSKIFSVCSSTRLLCMHVILQIVVHQLKFYCSCICFRAFIFCGNVLQVMVACRINVLCIRLVMVSFRCSPPSLFIVQCSCIRQQSSNDLSSL